MKKLKMNREKLIRFRIFLRSTFDQIISFMDDLIIEEDENGNTDKKRKDNVRT